MKKAALRLLPLVLLGVLAVAGSAFYSQSASSSSPVGNKILAHKLADLERKIEGHDASIRNLFDAIRQLMTPPEKPRREIGFHAILKDAGNPDKAKAKRK